MSVAAQNKFAALLNDDEDAKPVPSSKLTAKPGQQPADAKKNESRSSGPAARSGNYPSRGGGRGGKPHDRDGAVPSGAAPEDTNAGPRFDRTENRGDRGDRGGRGGRGRGDRGGRGERGERGGRRPDHRMDRHSRTDIVDSDKQVNQGWGNDAKEAITEAQGEADAQAEATQTPAVADGAAPDWGTPAAADWGAPAAADWGAPDADVSGTPAKDGNPDARPPRPVEEEDKTMTFEEYRASKTNTLTDLVGSTGPREANEGNADLFKDAQKLNKADGNESYFAGQTKTKAAKSKEKKQKETIEIDGQFSEPAGGGFRGGRGGRGGGGSLECTNRITGRSADEKILP
ncbi:hypothetical protein FRB98_003996 [Tulasnella sp. 332]|nr:hypothetical protein FRB98_003996 [Tulasnella sp. 332]